MRNIGEEILWDIVRVIKWIAMRVLRLFGKLFSFAWDKAKEKQEMKKWKKGSRAYEIRETIVSIRLRIAFDGWLCRERRYVGGERCRPDGVGFA